MPEPLSSVLPDANILQTKPGWSAFAGQELLARAAMEAIASWTEVERFMITLYVSLTGGPTSAGAAIFLAQETNSAKSAALTVLVNRKLSEPRRALYAAIAELIESRAGARDKLTHWIWGRSPELPDALILTDPRTLAAAEPGDRAERQLHQNSWVYGEADFREIIRANEELAGWGMDFHFMLVSSPGDETLYRGLCEEPVLREIMDRHASAGPSPEGEEPRS